MKSQPTTTLEDQAKAHLEDEFPDDYATAVRVVWWDDGGHLRGSSVLLQTGSAWGSRRQNGFLSN